MVGAKAKPPKKLRRDPKNGNVIPKNIENTAPQIHKPFDQYVDIYIYTHRIKYVIDDMFTYKHRRYEQ